jgi:hypothetical protein
MRYELPAAPLSIGGVIDNAIRLYRDSLRRCWILALLYSALLGVFGVFWGLALAQSTQGVASGTKDPRLALAALVNPAMMWGFALSMLVSLVFYGALMKTVSAWAKGDESLSLGGALAVGLRRLPAAVLGAVIYGLAIVIGLILLIVPGVYFFGKLQLWLPAMYVDDAGPVQGLGVSWRLTSGRWWRGTIILTVALAIIYVFTLALSLVSGAVTALAHLSLTDSTILGQVFGVVANMIVLPMFVAILIVMYHDFKLRSEGGDLAARVGALGKA